MLLLRTRGALLPRELLIKKMTHDPAQAFGMVDRGALVPGRRADINVIDMGRLSLAPPKAEYDLPLGGRRLLQRAVGYAHTFVCGQEVVRDDTVTNARPGRLCRCTPDPPAAVIEATAGDSTETVDAGTRYEYRVVHELSEIDLAGIDRSESRAGHYEYEGDRSNGVIRLVEVQDELSDWDDARRTIHMENFRGCVERGGVIVGAFDSRERLVGLAVLDGAWMGRQGDMLDMYFLFASRDVRGSGVGGALFERIATLARERHAKSLYICAANSRNTVDFYLRHGARVATGAELADEMLEAENSFPEDLRASLGADIHLVRDL